MLTPIHFRSSEDVMDVDQAVGAPELRAPQARCSNGVDTLAKSDAFWAFNQKVYPGLADAFYKNDSLVMIFNIKSIWCSTCYSNMWSEAQWDCKLGFFNRSMQADQVNIFLDPHKHTLIATCHSSELQNLLLEKTVDVGQAYQANISAFLNDQVHFEYTNVEFCLYPPVDVWINKLNVKNGFQLTNKPINLAACTMVSAGWRNSYEYTVEWLIYHMNQGFRHFYIYPDGDSAHWRCLLKPLIDIGVVEVHEWLWPETGFVHQQAQQNSCIYRYRGTATWVGLHDIDEFFQPMSSGLELEDIIAQYPLGIGALQVRSIFFGSNGNTSGQQTEKGNTKNPPGDDVVLVTENYVHRDLEALNGQRQKCLARPENVLTFSVHMITSGNAMVVPDPNILRVAHFKPNSTYPILDETMKSYSSNIKLKIKSLYPDGIPNCFLY